MTRLVVAVALCILFYASIAQASGLYFTERGVHGIGRAGAYVAGANGLDAVGYNPAGLHGTGLLGDLTQLVIDVRYRRELAIEDSAGTTQRVFSPSLHGQSELLPLPTFVAGYTTDDDTLTFAGGLFTPSFALVSFPSEVGGEPSPARYTLSGLTDSRLVQAGAWLAYRPNKKWSLGAGVHALVGTFRSSLAFTLSLPDRLLAAPEDPDYDAYGRISVGPFVAPSGTLGIQYTPVPQVTLGASGDLPTWLDSDSTFDVRLPTSAIFDPVSVRGKQARVSMRLPPVLRTGIEVRPIARLAFELAYVREFWSVHDQIVVKPKGVQIEDIPGGPTSIALPTIHIDRGYRDASSYRLGSELSGTFGSHAWFLRSGVAYERSAVPPAYLSLSSLDFNKVMLSLGLAAELTERLRLDVAYAHLFLHGENVSPSEAKLTRINPLSGNAPAETINGGRYRAHADVLSAGFLFLFR